MGGGGCGPCPALGLGYARPRRGWAPAAGCRSIFHCSPLKAGLIFFLLDELRLQPSLRTRPRLKRRGLVSVSPFEGLANVLSVNVRSVFFIYFKHLDAPRTFVDGATDNCPLCP